LATPAIIVSVATGSGTARCSGARHAAIVAAVAPNPIRVRKSRRVVSLSCSVAGASWDSTVGRPPRNSPLRLGPVRSSSGLFQ
jgi:hypothetical protein